MAKNIKKTTEDDLSSQERRKVKKEIAKEHIKIIKSEFRTQTSTAIIAAFGLVIALSWQTVIKDVVDFIPKSAFIQKYPFMAEIYSALAVTFLAVIGILIVSRWGKKQ